MLLYIIEGLWNEDSVPSYTSSSLLPNTTPIVEVLRTRFMLGTLSADLRISTVPWTAGVMVYFSSRPSV